MGTLLIQVPALCRLRHPAYLTLCARRSLAPPARAPTRPVTREIQSHTHSLRPATRGRGPLPPWCRRALTTERFVVIGIHGGTIMRTSLLGDATGTSPNFASTMKRAIETFLGAKGIRLECDTKGHGVRILVYRLRGRARLRDGWRSAYHTTKAGWRPGACIIGSALIFCPSRPGLRICISMLAYSSLSTLISSTYP